MKNFCRILESMGFQENDIARLYHSDQYCFSVWNKRKDNYSLSSMNPTFRENFNITEKDRTYYITDCFKVDCLKLVLEGRERLPSNNILSYIYKKEEQQTWYTIMEFKQDKIYLFSYRIRRLDPILRYGCFLEDGAAFSYDFIYEVEMTSNIEGTIVAYDSEFARLFQLPEKKRIPYGPLKVSETVRLNFFKALIHNQNLRAANIMMINNIQYPVLNEIILNVDDDIRKMIIMGNIIQEKQCELLVDLYNGEYSYLNKTYLDGYGILEKEGGKIVVRRTNSILRDFFQYDGKAEKKVLQSKSVFEALEKGHSSKETVTFIKNNGRTITCDLTTIPVIEKRKVLYIKIYLRPQYEKERKVIIQLVRLLTKREKEVLYYASFGRTNKSIADSLGIRESTVKRIIYNGYKKMKICSRMELEPFQLYLKLAYLGIEGESTKEK